MEGFGENFESPAAAFISIAFSSSVVLLEIAGSVLKGATKQTGLNGAIPEAEDVKGELPAGDEDEEAEDWRRNRKRDD